MKTANELKILKETCTTTNLGRCYNRQDYTILVQGQHYADTIDAFGNEYVEKNRRGQMNFYMGYKFTHDGNTEVFVSHTIDSSD